jgi:hypothetical protein
MSSVGAYTPPPPSFGQVAKEGFAFGTGSAIAQRVVTSILGAPTINVGSSGALCDKERLAFETCMKTKSADDFCGSEQTAYTQCIRLEKP